MRVLITGGEGQLGTAIAQKLDVLFEGTDHEYIAASHKEFDIGAPRAVLEQALRDMQPGYIINTAAFHNVAACEAAPATARWVKAKCPGWLAEHCERAGRRLIHISTDFVFGGDSLSPYREIDPPQPLNAYGASKLAGELLVLANAPIGGLVVRTSSLYGPGGVKSKGGNFVDTAIKALSDGFPMSVVGDVMVPNYVGGVASYIAKLVADNMMKRGVLHGVYSGYTSWYHLAREIAKLCSLDVNLVDLRERDPAESDGVDRPPFSALIPHREDQPLRLPHWRVGLYEYLRSIDKLTH
jgi:dTDP-4-dehydrorhamnose reductase